MHATITPNEKALLVANIEVLGEGSNLLSLLNAELYCLGCKPAFQSSIGAHFRHLLEHYSCFIEQYPSGQICYDKRCRDENLEKNRDFAIETLTNISNYLSDFASKYNTTSLQNQEFFIDDEVLENRLQTNMTRELMFLHSHTVHHYAIIAAMARMHGVQPRGDFGVAIATRVFNQSNCPNSSLLSIQTKG